MSHLKMWDIMDRATDGPFCEDDDFLYKIFFPKMKQVIRKYGIKFDPSQPVPADDDLADRVWQAAVEFFLHVGVLNADTHRRIMISESELKEALYLAPEAHFVGSGQDPASWQRRKVEDTRTPFCIFSPDITYDEDIFLPGIHRLRPGAAGRRRVRADPGREHGLHHQVGRAHGDRRRDGTRHAAAPCRQDGRPPGLFLVAVGTAQSDTGQIAVSNEEWGVRYTDGRLIGMLTEFKTDNELLNKVVHCRQFGCSIGCLTGAIYGGWAGGAEGTAILETAYHLVGPDRSTSTTSTTASPSTCTTRPTAGGRCCGWSARCIRRWPATAASSRPPTASTTPGRAPRCCYTKWRRTPLASTVSGGDLWESAPAHNKYRNYATPLEARLACEVGHAVARQGMSRAHANEIALQLVAKYESQIADAPHGKPFQECYEVKKIRPQGWYLDMYRRIKDELHQMGVEFPY